MSIIDIIIKKKRSEELTKQEIDFLIKGVTDDSIPDYQLSAFLMAVFFNGMTENETALLTMAMASSGDTSDLSDIEGFKVDKHSTGGVGDKTSLIIAPIVASLGVKVAKMSGRGLGHTGGTVDKLESIPNFKTSLPVSEFKEIVKKNGLAIIGQSGNFVPADKKLYALRDVTATVDSIPLIASSIMSKKLAAGANGIVLDVKYGSGAFMQTAKMAEELASAMVSIGKLAGKKTIAFITNMDIPLGNAVGNSLEIIEVLDVLSGKGPHDLKEVSVSLAAAMLEMSGLESFENCKKIALEQLNNGEALKAFKSMVMAQGGDVSVIDDTSVFDRASFAYDILANKNGYISKINTENIGKTATLLGAGRLTKEDSIDFSAGIMLFKKTGDKLESGDIIATFYSNNEDLFSEAEKLFRNSFEYSEQKDELEPLIYKVIS